MTLRTPILGIATAATVALGGMTAPAAAASSTQILSTAKSGFGVREAVVGVTPTTVYFQTRAGLYAMPIGGGAPTLVAAGGHLASVSGSDVLYRRSDGTARWRRANGQDAPADPTWTAISSLGGLYIDFNGGSPILYLQAGYQGTQTYLTSAGASDQLLASPTGVADISIGNPVTASFIKFADSHDKSAINTTGVGDSLACTSVAQSAVGCISGDGRVVRLSLTGAAPQIVTVSGEVEQVAVTNGATLWTTRATNGAVRLSSRPVGSASTSTLATFTPSALAANASAAVLSQFGATGTGGLYRTADAKTAPVKLRSSPADTLTAGPVGIGAGRVAWSDDAKTTGPVWSEVHGAKPVQIGASGIGSGPSVTDDDAPPIGQPWVAVSGRRTLFSRYAGPSHAAPLRTYRLTVTDGAHAIALPGASDMTPTLSGTHALYRRAADQHWLLYDLVTKRATDLTTALPLSSANYTPALSGDYVAYFKADGSVWRKQISSGAKTAALAKLTYPTFRFGVLVMDGDWITAERHYLDARFGLHDSTTIDNARTRSAPVTTTQSVVSASVGGVVVRDGFRNPTYRLRPWASSGLITLPATVREPTVYANLVGYLGVDGKPRVTTLSQHVANRPRALGPAQAAAKVKRGKTWTLRLPTSAPLTKCSVVVSLGRKAIRTLKCAKAASAQGEITVSWNGKNAKNKLAAKATYTWRVVAKNADGALLAVTGAAAATSGTVKLT